MAVQLLLEYGANVNVLGKFGASAFFIASQHGSTEVVKMLLIQGADVNVLYRQQGLFSSDDS